MTENEDEDPVGALQDPIGILTAAAIEAGLIPAGDMPDQNLIDFWMRAVGEAASVADRYRHPDQPDDTVGDVIRAQLFE